MADMDSLGDPSLHERVRDELSRVMRGVAPATDDDIGFAMTLGRPYWKFDIERARLPLPAIVRTVFVLLGSRNLGRGEKLAWEFTFSVDEISCAIASQKFGLRLYIDRGAFAAEEEAEQFSRRIIGSVIAGQKVVERDVLRPLGEAQNRAGNVTIRNQYGQLRRAYKYFREGVEIAYAGEGRLATTRPPGGGWWLAPERHEAWWNTFAMVVAYFSVLEHVLVGCLPFARFDPGVDNVVAFIGLKWNEKYKRIFYPSDTEATKFLTKLRAISEGYRNTYGHGGFDKFGATVAFHVPGVGAVPAVLSDIRTSPHFDFVPTAEADFADICSTFDEFEKWLSSGQFENAWAWITAGLDYRFDEQFRRVVEDTSNDFGAFLQYSDYLADQAANMDW
jgi:hypothetical protein